MAEIITKERLQRLVDRLNKMTGQPMEPYTKDGNGVTPNPGNYHLDWATGKPALDQMSGSAGGGTRNIIERSSKKEMYYKLFAFIEGYEACERNAGHDVRKNPRSTNMATKYKGWTYQKEPGVNKRFSYIARDNHGHAVFAANSEKAIRALLRSADAYLVKPQSNPLRSTDIAAHFNLDEFAATKAAELNNAMLKKHPPKKSGRRVVKPRINPRKKTTRSTRRVKLIKPNPKHAYVVVCLRNGKAPAYLVGNGLCDTDVKKARRFLTEANAKRSALAMRKIFGTRYQFGYKKI